MDIGLDGGWNCIWNQHTKQRVMENSSASIQLKNNPRQVRVNDTMNQSKQQEEISQQTWPNIKHLIPSSNKHKNISSLPARCETKRFHELIRACISSSLMGHDLMFLSARCDPILGGHELKNEKLVVLSVRRCLAILFWSSKQTSIMKSDFLRLSSESVDKMSGTTYSCHITRHLLSDRKLWSEGKAVDDESRSEYLTHHC